MTLEKYARALTPRRLRAHALVIALGLWSIYFWDMATPGLRDREKNLKGTDFLHFYTTGSLALRHRGGELYDMQAQAQLAEQRVPAAKGLRYQPLYPPQVSIFFAPFAYFSYPFALILWEGLSFLIYAMCCYLFWRDSPNLVSYGVTVAIAALGFPGFWNLIAWGQSSALALACFTLAYFALRDKREFLAGMALGCLAFKPQLALAAALVFVVTFRRKVIAGGVVSEALQFFAAFAYYGLGPLREWLHIMFNLPALLYFFEPKPYQTHCLRTFWSMLVPWPAAAFALYVVSALLVAGLTVACWRSGLPLALRYSALLIATVLVAPHLTAYDLVILGPAFILLSGWILSNRGEPASRKLAVLLYFAFILPLIGPLARWTHVQLSVPVMAAILFWIWNHGQRATADSLSPG